MVAEVTATIAIGNACFIDGSACDWRSASSCITISVATIVVYSADISNIHASISNSAKELRNC